MLLPLLLGLSTCPLFFTPKQVGEWKDRNPWLDIKEGKLGCLVCGKAKTLLLSEKKPGLHLAEEWINGDVSSSNAKGLRKKTYKHGDSQAHARSVEIAQMKEKDTGPYFEDRRRCTASKKMGACLKPLCYLDSGN